MPLDRDKAKEILSATHWDRDLAASDPELQEIYAFLESDPELQAWLEQEIAFDEAIARKLEAVETPDLLKQTLLEASREGQRKNKKVVTLGLRIFAAAAALVLFAGLGFLYLVSRPFEFKMVQQDSSFESFRYDMSDFANGLFRLDFKDKSFPTLNSWLDAHGGPQYGELPGSVASLESLGCKVLDWGTHKVSLLCFHDTDGDLVHIFIVNRAVLGDLPGTAAELAKSSIANELDTAAWTRGDKVYLLVGGEPGTKVGPLLPGPAVALIETILPAPRRWQALRTATPEPRPVARRRNT